MARRSERSGPFERHRRSTLICPLANRHLTGNPRGLDVRLVYGHAHSVSGTFLIVTAVAVLGILLIAVLRTPRRPTDEDLRHQRAYGLLARLEGMPTVQLHDLFVRLAYSPTEQQDWLENVLDELRDASETDGYSPGTE